MLRSWKIVAMVVLICSTMAGLCLANDVCVVELRNLDLLTIEGKIEPLIFTEGSTLVYFTRLGCKYCHAFEENAIEDLLERVSKIPSVNLVIVAYGAPDDIDTMYGKYSVPIYLGTKLAWDSFDILGVPSFFLVSPEGVIEWDMVGFPPDADIEYFSSLWFVLNY